MADPRENESPRRDPEEEKRSEGAKSVPAQRDVGKTPHLAEGEDPDHPTPTREGPGKTPGRAEG